MAINELIDGVVSSLGGHGGVTEQFTSLAQQLQQLAVLNQATAEIMRGNATAAVRNTSSQSGSSTGSFMESGVGTVLKDIGFGLGLSPLITGLIGLFGGGGGSSAPPPLMKFALPGALHVDAGISEQSQGVFAVDTGQGQRVRPILSGAGTGPQITVQVHAMDSRSFLDRSQDIALAVRQAMLESSVLNDVIREA